MSLLRLPKSLHPDFSTPNKQPLGDVEIDWSNPLARSLKFFSIPQNGKMRDFVSELAGSESGTIAYGRDLNGNYARSNGSASIGFSGLVHNIGSGANTMLARYKWDGTGSNFQTVMSLPNNNQLGVYWPEKPATPLMGQDSTTAATQSWSGAVIANQVETFSISSTGSGATADGYREGIKQTVIAPKAHTYSGSTGLNLFVGQGSEYAEGFLYFAAVWNRKLTDAEQFEFARDPYQILKPKTQAFYFVPDAATGSFTLSADSGAYNYTGATNDLLLGALLSADSGAYSYTGTAVDLTTGFNLQADSGTYTYTGTDAALTFASAGEFTLSADSGVYNYTGTDASLKAAFNLEGDPGNYTYTGTDAALAFGYSLAADSGGYTYTGTDVTFSTTIRLNAESGNYVYNGNNATLRASGQVWTVQTDSVTTWTTQTDSNTIWNIEG